MEHVNAIIDRALVILRAAPTYLTALAVIAGIVLDELGELGPLPGWLVTALAGVITAVAVTIAIIRRVTPVLTNARGVLPPPAGTPITAAELELHQREQNRANDLGMA